MNEVRVPGQQSVRRAIDVLFCFDSDASALTAADVATRLGMNRTTAWRYLQTLSGTGLVRELGEARFGLGARTIGLAEAYTGQWGDLEAIAGAALVRLRDRVGETAALHLREGWSRIVVRQVESRHELHRTYRDLGQPISLLTGAPSMAVLASIPRHEREPYLATHVEDPAERRRLEAELGRIATAGFALSRGSRVSGVASVAAALHDATGQVLGAVNVTGPASRLPDSGIAGIAEEVITAARWIEDQVNRTTPPSSAEPATTRRDT